MKVSTLSLVLTTVDDAFNVDVERLLMTAELTAKVFGVLLTHNVLLVFSEEFVVESGQVSRSLTPRSDSFVTSVNVETN